MPRTVLFVDDNPVILKTIQVAFANEDFTVLLASSGKEGLLLVEEHHPKVIVTDLRMPEMDGLEFLKKARELNYDWLGMIFTAYLDVDSAMQAVGQDYVWRYIVKPWKDNRELVLAVRNAIQLQEEKLARQQAEEQAAKNERLAGLGRLIAGMAHQFNNINVGIIGYAQMAQKYGPLSTEVEDCFEKINAFAQRATEVVKDLSVFTDQSSKTGVAQANLSGVANDALFLLKKEMGEKGIIVEKHFEKIPDIVIDADLIRQVIFNLLENAQHAVLDREDRKISLVTGEKDGRVFVRIIDNGCGISPKHLSSIFEHFFTTKGTQAPAGSSNMHIPGVGLGLSLAQIIVKSHNGELTVESEEGKGSQFTLWLPLG